MCALASEGDFAILNVIISLGISIAVLGTLGANNTNQTAPQSQYQLDENKPVVYQPILTSGAQRNQKFYQSPEVLYDKHTLIVTNLINGSSLLIIDYFVVATANSTISASGQSTGTQNGTADPAVVGGSVGGVLGFIVLLALGIYIWRRRKSKTEFEFDSTVVQSGKDFCLPFFRGPAFEAYDFSMGQSISCEPWAFSDSYSQQI